MNRKCCTLPKRRWILLVEPDLLAGRRLKAVESPLPVPGAAASHTVVPHSCQASLPARAELQQDEKSVIFHGF